MTVQQISAHHILTATNDRQQFNAEKLRSLAASIQSEGLAQPPTLRRILYHEPDDLRVAVTDKPLAALWTRLYNNRAVSKARTLYISDDLAMPAHKLLARYELVMGERRVRAMRDILLWETIPCQIQDYSDTQAWAMMLLENTARVDLNPMEQAKAFQSRLKKGWDMQKIVEVSGLSAATVRARLDLLKLNDNLQHLVKSGNLPVGHASLLTTLDKNRQLVMMKLWAHSPGMAFEPFRQRVVKLAAEQAAEAQTAMFDMAALMAEMQADLPDPDRPLRGKDAVAGAPVNPDLPPVRWHSRDNIAKMMERYICDLLDKGFDGEAAALGTFFTACVATNTISVPLDSQLNVTTARSGDLAPLHKMNQPSD